MLQIKVKTSPPLRDVRVDFKLHVNLYYAITLPVSTCTSSATSSTTSTKVINIVKMSQIISSETNQSFAGATADQIVPQVIECTFSKYEKTASYNLSLKDIGRTCRKLLGIPREAIKNVDKAYFRRIKIHLLPP